MMLDEAQEADIAWSDYPTVTEALFAAVAPVAPPAGLRERVLARIADTRVSIHRGEGGDWVRHPNAAGIETRELHRDDDRGIRTYYLRMAPGAAIPPHRHLTAEECFVISGELESFGTILRPGDYIRAASGTQHGTSRSEGGCLLLLTSAMNSSLT